jgi:hypothetical protein
LTYIHGDGPNHQPADLAKLTYIFRVRLDVYDRPLSVDVVAGEVVVTICGDTDVEADVRQDWRHPAPWSSSRCRRLATERRRCRVRRRCPSPATFSIRA